MESVGTGTRRRPITGEPREGGFASGVGMLATAVVLVLMAVLTLMAMNGFGGGSSGSGAGGTPNGSILSQSSAESQLKLCAEGRDSRYGSPPSSARQAKCVNDLAAQIAGGGPGLPGASEP